MADIIEIIFQGIDRVSGVADTAATGIEKRVAQLKRDAADVTAWKTLENEIKNLQDRLNTTEFKRLEGELNRLKGSLRDDQALDRFSRAVQRLKLVLERPVEAAGLEDQLDKITRAARENRENMSDLEVAHRTLQATMDKTTRDARELGENFDLFRKDIADTTPEQKFDEAVSKLRGSVRGLSQEQRLQTEIRKLRGVGGEEREVRKLDKAFAEFKANLNKTTEVDRMTTALINLRHNLAPGARGPVIKAIEEITKLKSAYKGTVDVDRLGQALEHLKGNMGDTEAIQKFDTELTRMFEDVKAGGASTVEFEKAVRNMARVMGQTKGQEFIDRMDKVKASLANVGAFGAFGSALDRLRDRMAKIAQADEMEHQLAHLRTTILGVDSPTAKLERTLESLRAELGDTPEFRNLEEEFRRVQRSISATGDSVDVFGGHMEKSNVEIEEGNRQLEFLDEHMAQVAMRFEDTDHQLGLFHRSVGAFREGSHDAEVFNRAVFHGIPFIHQLQDEFDGVNKRGNVFTRVARDVERVLRRTFSSLAEGFSVMKESGQLVEFLKKGFNDIAKETVSGLGRVLQGFRGGFQGINLLISAVIFLLPVFTAALQVAAGAVSSMVGTVGALASALSALVGVLIIIPAAVLAVGGAFAAIALIIGPAIQGVLKGYQSLKQMENDRKERARTRAAGRDPVADAERQLARTIRDNGQQIADSERRLHVLRIHNREQEQDAVRALNRVREEGAQRLLATEQRLADLRKTNQETRAQFEQNLALARLSLANANTEMGRQLAQAGVGEAQMELGQFERGPSVEREKELQKDVAQQRKSQTDDIAEAERRLFRVRRDNADQEKEAEIELHHLRQRNADQLEDALRRVADAHHESEQQASEARKAWDGLSPAQRRAAREVKAIVDEFGRMAGPIKTKVFTFLDELFGKIRANMPLIVQDVGLFTTTLIDSLQDALGRLDDKKFMAVFQEDVKGAADLLGSVASAVGHIAGGFVYMLHAAQPFLDWISTVISDFGLWFEQWAKVNDENGRFGRLFKATKQILQDIGAILKPLGDAFLNIFEVGFSSGEGALKNIADLAERFKRFTESAKGKNEIKKFFDDSLQAAGALFKFIGRVIGGFISLGKKSTETGKDGVSGWVGALDSAGDAADRFFKWVDGFNDKRKSSVKNFLTGLGDAFMGLVHAIEELQPMFTVFAEFIKLVGWIVNSRLFQDLAIGVGVFLAVWIVFLVVTNWELILIIAAIVLVVIVFGELFRQLMRVIGWIKDHFTLKPIVDALKWVGNWIKDHWKTILLSLTAPVYVAAQLVLKHWEWIKGIFSRALTFIRNLPWGTVLRVVTGIFTLGLSELVRMVGRHIGDIKDWFVNLKNYIVAFFTETLPRIAGQIVSGIGNFFTTIFDELKNQVTRLFDWFGAQIDKIPGGKLGKRLLGGAIGFAGGLTDALFAEGGVVPGAPGTPVRAIVHAGEWVLNREQQSKFVSMMGGWPEARNALFSTPVVTPRTSFKSGGQVAAGAGTGRKVEQNLTINTSSPDVDIDYVMRIANARLAGAT